MYNQIDKTQIVERGIRVLPLGSSGATDHVDFSLFGLHRKVVSHKAIKVLLRKANSGQALVLAQIDAVRVDHRVQSHGVLHRSKVG